ncbi:hypothetical protein vseg_004212 [Gypsophila vaccaria]
MAAIGGDCLELPLELIEEIILKIDLPEDVLSSSLVCRAWYTAFMRIRARWTPANPWLLLSENTQNNSDCVRTAYNPANNKCYQLKLPQTFGRNCWGSDFGWIVTFGLDLVISLFNPITKLQLCLPSIDTLTRANKLQSVVPEEEYVCNGDCKYYRQWMRRFHIVKACVLKTGKAIYLCTNDDDDIVKDEGLLVAVAHLDYDSNDNPITHLSVARPGDSIWTPIKTPTDILIADVSCCKDLLWVCDNKCSLWYVDLYNEGPPFLAIQFLLNPQILVDGYTHNVDDFGPHPYLVNAFNNGLLLITRFGKSSMNWENVDDNDDDCFLHRCPDFFWKSESASTEWFSIYKLDSSSKLWKCVATSELEDVFVYLGKNTSLVSKRGADKSKSIYFAGDGSIENGRDMGVFNLHSNEIESFYNGDHVNSSVSMPFWFTPRLC